MFMKIAGWESVAFGVSDGLWQANLGSVSMNHLYSGWKWQHSPRETSQCPFWQTTFGSIKSWQFRTTFNGIKSRQSRATFSHIKSRRSYMTFNYVKSRLWVRQFNTGTWKSVQGTEKLGVSSVKIHTWTEKSKSCWLTADHTRRLISPWKIVMLGCCDGSRWYPCCKASRNIVPDNK